MTSSEPLDPCIAALYEIAERLSSPGPRVVKEVVRALMTTNEPDPQR